MKNNKKFILIIIFLGLIPIFWFKSGYIIAKGDIFPLWSNSLNTFFYDNFLWESASAGQTATWPQYDIFATIWYLLQKVSINVNVIQIIFQIFYFLGAGLAMYFLAVTIYKKNKIAPVIASVFYMFNFVMLLRTLNFGVSWTLVFLPVLLAFYIRIIDNIRNNLKPIKNIIGFAVTSTILMSFASINIPLLALIFIANFIIFIYYFISEKNIRLKIIQNLFVLFIMIFLINIWWVIPLLQNLLSINSGGSQIGAVINVVKWSWTQARGSFLNLFWLNGSWGWRPEYFPYINAYSNPVMIFIVFVPMLIAFSGLLFKNYYRKTNLYFASVIIFLMFLAKGLHAPLGNVNLLFYKYIPGFFLFREPFPKFYMILIIFLSLLIGSSSNSIVNLIQRSKNRYRKRISVAFVFSIIAVFLISTFPLITGEVITKGTKGLPFSSYIKIPGYWYQSTDYINKKTGDFKVLITPEDDFPYKPYKWGYYGSVLPSRLIIKPILQQPYGYIVNNYYKKMITTVYDSMKDNSMDYNYLLAFFNVKYILQRNDIWWNFTHRKTVSPQTIKSFLSNQKGIQFEKSFGKLDLYKVSNNYFLPHIYPSATSTVVAGNIGALVPTAETGYLDRKPVLLFAQQETGNGEQITDKNLKDVNSFVFKDSTRRDLAVELSTRFIVHSPQSTVNLKRSGTYEIFVDTASFSRDILPSFRIKVDDKELIRFEIPKEFYSKYLKIAQVEIKEPGKHEIQVTGPIGNLENKKQKMVLVNEQEKVKIEKLIRQRMNEPGVEAAYIFSRDGEFWVP